LSQSPSPLLRALLAVATLSLASTPFASSQVASAQIASGQVQHAVAPVSALSRVSPAIATATDLGSTASSQQLTLTVRLKPSDALHAAVADRYNPASPDFHKWMTDSDLQQYAPSAEQIGTVRTALENHGLQILSVSSNNLSIRVTGTASQVESAFHTSLHQFSKAGVEFRANTAPAQLDGAANTYVSSVAGLESHTAKNLFKRAVNLKTGKPYPSVTLKKVQAAGGLSSLITEDGLTTPTLFNYGTPGASLPNGYFYGNQYAVNQTLTIGFTAPQLQAAYGLPAAYAKGLDGTGQTILLLEAYGYSALESDANAFSSLNGLPPLTSDNFSIVYPQGVPANQDEEASLTGWPTEIALDIDWAHSIAPGAKIVVVATNGQDSEDFQNSMDYIIDNNLGYDVSDSWEEDTDLIAGPVEEQSYDDILEVAAAKGISFQFSSGDGGDGGLGTPLGAPGVPSNSPHATAVGGTALLNNINGNNAFLPLGWGDTVSLLTSEGLFDPPLAYGFFGGAGGGESTYFAKPSWQAALPGTGRQVPDVSALADPYTGVPIVVTSGGVQYIFTGVGGTSLASPIFTAFWAIAQQSAGGPLGQAAPLVASLAPTGGIEDVLPLTSPTNPIGLIFDSAGYKFYSSDQLLAGLLGTQVGYSSAVWDLSSPGYPFAFDFGFGLDTSLTITQGWDNVTGYGTPYGLTFINAVTAAAKK
jgi:subtilase family serine protease